MHVPRIPNQKPSPDWLSMALRAIDLISAGMVLYLKLILCGAFFYALYILITDLAQ
jgi:hypothetical protein